MLGSYKYMMLVLMVFLFLLLCGGIMENVRIREMMVGRVGKLIIGWGVVDVVMVGGIKVDLMKGGLVL